VGDIEGNHHIFQLSRRNSLSNGIMIVSTMPGPQ
jgi:hypothetical protein